MNLSSVSRRDLRLSVEELLAAYATCLDEGRLEEWPGFFTENCLYRIVSRENWDRGLPLAAWLSESRGMLQDRVTALRQANVYGPRYLRHLVSSVQITGVENGKVRAQSNFAILQTLQDDETRVFLSGKYVDVLVAAGEGLVFAEKHCVYDTLRIPNSIVFPV